MPRKKKDLPTFNKILEDALDAQNIAVTRFLFETYKEDFVKSMRDDILTDERYHSFLFEAIGDSMFIDLEVNLDIIRCSSDAALRADSRYSRNKFNSSTELLHLLVSDHIDNGFGSIQIKGPFISDPSSGNEAFTFAAFNNDANQIKISTSKNNFPESHHKGDKWQEYETVCKYLDTYEDKKEIASKILECIQWIPENHIEVVSGKADEFLNNIIIPSMREDLNLDELDLNQSQARAANILYGLTVCEHHRVSGVLKHFKKSLRLVDNEENGFSQVFGDEIENTKFIPSISGGTGEMRSVSASGIVPDGADLNDSFEYSDDSDEETNPSLEIKFKEHKQLMKVKEKQELVEEQDDDEDVSRELTAVGSFVDRYSRDKKTSGKKSAISPDL